MSPRALIGKPENWGAFFCCLLWTVVSVAQERPYIGFVYPAGGQQGTVFEVRLGGQGIGDVTGVQVTGTGVKARITENYRRLELEELQFLGEQLRLLRRQTLSAAAQAEIMMAENTNNAPEARASWSLSNSLSKDAARQLMDRIEKRTMEYVVTPDCPAIASLVLVEVTIDPDATPGEREIRLVTLKGISNPLAFHVGQVPEVSRKPMVTSSLQVLGKEAQALRRRLPGEIEERIALPCTVNGQIASGEVNRYRFSARRGQRLVISTLGRQLVPFIADAVPGWFQPVLTLYDADGKEVAYQDDFRFKPDPTILFEVPRDGEYVFAIHDSIYRGREDFVYRITVGELPFITSVFPLGGPAGAVANPKVVGWNLQSCELTRPPPNAKPGLYSLAAAKKGAVSNHLPFVLDTLPELDEQEPNDRATSAQKVTLPVIVNGRIEKPGEWDVFAFAGKADDIVVAEVRARRLDSPLDSVLKVTDSAGSLLAFNDDHEDLGAGLNTHQADSYLKAKLPGDGLYCIHIGDTSRRGGEEYGYRLRIGAPQPDFDLRVVPSSLSFLPKSSGSLTVYAQRKDGFAGPITLALKDPPAGFQAAPVTLFSTQTVAQLVIKTDLVATREPLNLMVFGTGQIEVGGREITRRAVPAEDRMQAFLWRHLVPAQELKVIVFDPAYEPPPKRIARGVEPVRPRIVPAVTNSAAGTNAVPPPPRLTKQQVTARLKQLRFLFEEGMFTDEFYLEKTAELKASAE